MPHARRGAVGAFAAVVIATAPDQAQGRWSMDNALPRRGLQVGAPGDFPAPRFATQRQDHFDTANTRVWQQAYFVNDTFWTPGSDAPIFLCVGGEGPALDGSAVVSSVHCNIAVEWLPETKGLMFALEHRYYGCHNMSACPVDNFDVPKEALKYLSSRQAIEDVASFVQQMNTLYKLTAKNKWVTWGGSYPGMLAGWSRLRHPELIHASVASSAPVHAKLDMWEYNDAVANAYAVSDNKVGGSPACRDAIREGHRAVEDMLKAGQTSELEQLLGLPAGSLASKDAQRAYLGNGMAEFPAQSNDPACTEPGCNIGKICEVMLDTTHGDELHRLVALRQIQAQGGLLRAPRSVLTSGDQPDFWYYQTCTEFGFYQSCGSDSSCLYVRGLVTAESEGAACKDLYNITLDDIKKSIQETNKHYGGLKPLSPSGKLGSCVMWPNGEVDPWATLSVLQSPDPSQPVLTVPGASHHAWTHPTYPTDQLSVIQSRKTIREQVQAFLAQDCLEPAELNIVV